MTNRLLLLSVAVIGVAHAEVKLPSILSSHMVLQRDRPIHIWGWANPGEKVSASLRAAKADTTADAIGSFSLYLPPEPAGGPYSLTVSASNRITLDDVLIGDVWLASGQSNMEMPLRGFDGAPVKNGAAEIAAASHPHIRLLNVPHKSADIPLRNVDASWTACTPETAANFSAVAYFFGRELAGRFDVPIGLIDSTWGGTVVEAWISLTGISSDPGLMPVFATRAHMMQPQADMDAILAFEARETEAARKAGKPLPKFPWHPDPASWAPAGLFNAMIAPLTPYPIKGAIWYQGESNSRIAFAPTYARAFPALIADWRSQWHQGSFPFLFVQISSFASDLTESWPTIREAQRRTLFVANTAMAVTIDIGDPENVHPADKQTVAARLALGARAMAYGEAVESVGPMYRQATAESGGIRIWFDHAAGLTAHGGAAIGGFEIAGDDGIFAAATARIEGPSVLVRNPQVANPKQVRYGWTNAPLLNLFNGAGLPASPFTTEDAIPAP
jgi:sialate O-acetylesterase